MDVRAKQRLCLLACPFNPKLCVGGFAPRHLNRCAASCFPQPTKCKIGFMIDARQNLIFTLFGVKLFAALLFVLCTAVMCSAQTVAPETCDFSKYKPTGLSHFILSSIVEEAKPAYPPAARAVRAEGKVRVKILVDRRGTVKETYVVEGHPLLRAAAVQAARETRFKPNFGLSRSFAKGKRFLTDELVYNFTLE